MPVTEAEAAAALPSEGWIRRYVIHAVKQTTAPLVYHLGVGITTLGTTCPINYGMHYAGTLRANNFCLLVGRSGEDQKSSALHIAREILHAAAPPLVGDFPGSPEGLIDSLAEVPSQMIPISEFGKFLSSAQRGYFEPTKTLLADVWDCLGANCTILGSDGWKGTGEVKVGDKVWALDPETDQLVLSDVLAVGSRSVRPNERMVRLKGHNHDIYTTEGHRFYVKYRDPRQSYRPSPHYLVKTGKQMAKRRSAFYLPFSAPPANPQPGVDFTDDELRFIAWAITDSTLLSEERRVVRLHQAEHKHLGRIRELLLRLGMSWGEDADAGPTNFGRRTSPCWTLYVHKESWKPYTTVLDKDLAPVLMQMSRGQFEVFWHELLLADGEQVGEGMKGLLWSTRARFVDRLQYLAVINGFSTQYGTRELPSGKTAYRMSVTAQRHVCTDPGNAKSVRFEYVAPDLEEQVWCVTTEHGTLVTRHNGKVVILGNCLPLQRRRANNRVVQVDEPRLSIGAACSIPYLEKHTLAEDWTGGFMGRWCVLYGRRERLDADPVGDRTDVQWLINELRHRAMTPSAGWCVGLDAAAKRYWEDWFNDVMQRDLPSNIVGIRSRAPTIARKAALVYGWDFGPAQGGKPWRMPIDVLEPGIRLAELHIDSLIDLSDAIAEHADARFRRSVLRAIDQKNGVATLGEILSILKTRKRIVLEHLDALEIEGRVGKLKTNIGVVYEHRP